MIRLWDLRTSNVQNKKKIEKKGENGELKKTKKQLMLEGYFGMDDLPDELTEEFTK